MASVVRKTMLVRCACVGDACFLVWRLFSIYYTTHERIWWDPISLWSYAHKLSPVLCPLFYGELPVCVSSNNHSGQIVFEKSINFGFMTTMYWQWKETESVVDWLGPVGFICRVSFVPINSDPHPTKKVSKLQISLSLCARCWTDTSARSNILTSWTSIVFLSSVLKLRSLIVQQFPKLFPVECLCRNGMGLCVQHLKSAGSIPCLLLKLKELTNSTAYLPLGTHAQRSGHAKMMGLIGISALVSSWKFWDGVVCCGPVY